MTYQGSLTSPGGGTRSMREISKCLVKLGIQLIVIPITSNPKEEILEDSINVIPVLLDKKHYLLSGINVLNIVKKLIREYQVDAVISWGHEAAFLKKTLDNHSIIHGMIAAHPSYTEWKNRNTNFKLVKNFIDSWFRFRPLRLADIVFVSSKFTYQELVSSFDINPENLTIIGRGIDSIFSQVERSHISKSISNLIFYGSFAPIKGVFDVIEALGIVASRGQKDWKLRLAGWGYENEVKQALKQQGIEENVTLLGCLKPEKLAEELAWANLAILPSRAESFGRAVAEAQASGLAVVSYEVGSIPEIVEKGVTGWLVQPQQTNLLADAILEAMSNPERTRQMGLMGQKKVLEKFSWKKTAELILEGIELAKKNIN